MRLVPPASRVGTCLLANDCVSTEDPASKLLFFFGFPTSAHVGHTVPGVEGEGWSRCALERGSKESGKKGPGEGLGAGDMAQLTKCLPCKNKKGPV